MYLMTDEALTSLGKKVPDIKDYTSNNSILNFSMDLNTQLYNLIGFSFDEIKYLEDKINTLR